MHARAQASASLPALAAAPAQQPAAPLNPTALVSAATSSGAQATGSGDAGLVTKLLDTIPDIFKGIKTDEDPFGAVAGRLAGRGCASCVPAARSALW
jgi:hypothetical protein